MPSWEVLVKIMASEVPYDTTMVSLSTSIRMSMYGVSRQQRSDNVQRGAGLTSLIVPAVYHCRIRDRLLAKSKTCDADVYSNYRILESDEPSAN